MTSIKNTNVPVQTQQPVVVNNLPQNVRRVNFKAEKDNFTKQQNAPVYTQPPMLDQQAAMRKALEDQKKAQKNAKRKQNISWGIGVASGLAIVALVVSQFVMMKGAGFNLKNLEFKSLAGDDSIFDLKTSKSLHPKVKKFFNELLEKGKIPEDIAKRAGILGEGGTNSVLLLGGSGVGKTEVIKAYAKAAEADYVAIKVSDFANSYVNGTSKNISEMIDALIKRAKDNPKKQLVISLDEVDALVKVTAHDSSGEIAKNRQSLLTGIDNLLEMPNIKLFTSSNADVGSLDGAFLRRCGYNFEVPMPDKEQLREALKFQLRKCEGAMENDGVFFKDNAELDTLLEELVDRKCAFGDVKNIVKGAKDKYALDMNATGQANKKFSVSYLKEVLDNIQTTAGEKAAIEGSFV